MLSKTDYEQIAKIIGNTFAAASMLGNENFREAVYDNLYLPFVAYAEQDNPRFDHLRFSYAVGVAEHSADPAEIRGE